MFSIVIFLMFVNAFLILFILLDILFYNRRLILIRLDKISEKKEKKEYDELDMPFHQRVIKPIAENLSSLISKATPGGIKSRINEKLIMAGNPFNIGINQWLLIKSFFGIIIPLTALFFVLAMGNLTIKRIVILIVVSLISYVFPELILSQLTKKRQKEIVNSLPDVLDLLTVSVEAGLSFDGALARLVNKFEGHLSNEFGRVLNEIRIGRSRSEALKEMCIRCGVADLTAFIGSIIQADELGVGISKVLRVQSEQMRQKRRQRAQEKAMKAPIKMLFPLIFFIFPTIFAVLLGPALIRFITEFAR